jgi:redox-sensitive bicupin YhaK (pirin superfamily)
MMKIRRSHERGHAEHGWLDSYHTFSFGDYYDPANMGFRDLRVINEDWISGGRGFPQHPHKDMEIVTYVIEGALEHRDTLGTNSVIRPGEIQCMTAGTGIEHSEFNSLKDQRTHLLQIWILPNQRNRAPGYGQKSFASDFSQKPFVLLTSGDGREGSVQIHQDVDLFGAKWDSARTEIFQFRNKERYGWLQVVAGDLSIDSLHLSAGDGLVLSQEKQIQIETKGKVEFLLFDLN